MNIVRKGKNNPSIIPYFKENIIDFNIFYVKIITYCLQLHLLDFE